MEEESGLCWWRRAHSEDAQHKEFDAKKICIGDRGLELVEYPSLTLNHCIISTFVHFQFDPFLHKKTSSKLERMVTQSPTLVLFNRYIYSNTIIDEFYKEIVGSDLLAIPTFKGSMYMYVKIISSDDATPSSVQQRGFSV